MTPEITYDFWAHAQQITATIVSLLIIAAALYKPFQWVVVRPIQRKLDQIEKNSNDNRKQWEAIESQGNMLEQHFEEDAERFDDLKKGQKAILDRLDKGAERFDRLESRRWWQR